MGLFFGKKTMSYYDSYCLDKLGEMPRWKHKRYTKRLGRNYWNKYHRKYKY
jgi:hypothetical protein